MDQNEEKDIFNVDIASAALSYNTNLVVVYNNKKIMLYHEALQEMTEKFQNKMLTLSLFCAMVNEHGEPCKNKEAKNSFEFVARAIPEDEVFSDFKAK